MDLPNTLSGSDASDASTAEPPSLSASDFSLAASDSRVTDDASPSADALPGVTREQMDAVRSQVDPGLVGAVGLDDATVARFVRATGGNLPLSAKRLTGTMQWRKQVRPQEVVCRACAKDPRSHYMHLIGHCKLGRPIIYSCLELAKNKVFEDNRDHMIQTFEWAVKCMPPGVEQWIWVCDFKGFGMADVNPKLAKLFLDISAEYYPERLGLFMIVDAPSLFGMLWKAIRSFVDPKTHKKIRFLPYDGEKAAAGKSALKTEMDLHFDPVTVDWLLAEMAENRDKAKVPNKVYSMYSMYEQALEGGLCSRGKDEHGHGHGQCLHGHLAVGGGKGTAGAGAGAGAGQADVHVRAGGISTAAAAPAAAGQHNVLGTPALLHTFNMQPELLLPQATASG